ncbi:hypothetical protein [Niastella populi]|uniref:hypothetical protein n=1 Tax=Niastella populi TaxID=550983 RepID=UPI0010566DE7|nr:hypothetical protein [Niastella populi]
MTPLILITDLLREIFGLHTRLHEIKYTKYKNASKVIKIIIIHGNDIPTEFKEIDSSQKKELVEKFNSCKNTSPLEDWSLIAINDENGNVNTLPALVLSEEQSKKLQKIIAKYNL